MCCGWGGQWSCCRWWQGHVGSGWCMRNPPLHSTHCDGQRGGRGRGRWSLVVTRLLPCVVCTRNIKPFLPLPCHTNKRVSSETQTNSFHANATGSPFGNVEGAPDIPGLVQHVCRHPSTAVPHQQLTLRRKHQCSLNHEVSRIRKCRLNRRNLQHFES